MRLRRVACRSRLAGAQEPSGRAGTNDPRVGLKPGLHDAGVAARNMELVSSMPKPDGFFDPKAPAGVPTPPETPATRRHAAAPATPSGREHRAAARPRRRRQHAAAAAAAAAELRELRPRVQRQSSVPRQLPRVQHLRHREPAAAAAAGVDRLPGRTGRRVGPRQPAVHVGRADARPDRLRHAGRAGAGQRRALPRRPHFRHQRSAQAEAGRGRADLPRLAHAHAGHRSEGQGATSTSTDPAPARCARARSSRAARA